MKAEARARGRRASALLGAVTLAALVGCGPRNKIGDQLLGQDSITNGRSSLSNTAPQKSP